MFCSHTSDEEDQEWINRRGMVSSKNAQHDKAKRFLDELTIFSVSPVESKVNSSASLAPAVVPEWKTAVDPHSGRTYYYDSITRKTQWEKVRPTPSPLSCLAVRLHFTIYSLFLAIISLCDSLQKSRPWRSLSRWKRKGSCAHFSTRWRTIFTNRWNEESKFPVLKS
jgi:hypothetical protein